MVHGWNDENPLAVLQDVYLMDIHNLLANGGLCLIFFILWLALSWVYQGMKYSEGSKHIWAREPDKVWTVFTSDDETVMLLHGSESKMVTMHSMKKEWQTKTDKPTLVLGLFAVVSVIGLVVSIILAIIL